jgi:hypothetical protein
MSLTKEDWRALRGKRAEITSALQALGIPHDGWINELPDFRQGYEPKWAEIEKIALSVKAKGKDEWPGPYVEKKDVPEKKVARKGPKKGKR